MDTTWHHYPSASNKPSLTCQPVTPYLHNGRQDFVAIGQPVAVLQNQPAVSGAGHWQHIIEQVLTAISIMENTVLMLQLEMKGCFPECGCGRGGGATGGCGRGFQEEGKGVGVCFW
jgi:hypothetical protein